MVRNYRNSKRVVTKTRSGHKTGSGRGPISQTAQSYPTLVQQSF
jgi:ribosomal protein L15